MTGWNMPPGCNVSDIPGQDEGPCAICCQPVIECVCPECPKCEAQGDPICYRKHGLKLNKRQMICRQRVILLHMTEMLLEQTRFLAQLVDSTEQTQWDLDDVDDPFE